ncbi:TolC family protein [Zhongshania sp.]|uniref:TolC family protein n=1 Tax=Zhongshania sp. TaxID=1971902 RepID=UPI00356AA46B
MHVFSPFQTPEKPIVNRFFWRKAITLLSLLLIMPAVSLAETSLTLSEAIQRSFANHPELRAFSYRRAAADGMAQQARVGSRPQLDLSVEDALGSGDYSGADSLQSTLSISWVLEGDLLQQRGHSADVQKRVISDEQAIKKLDVAAETARQFLTVVVYQQRKALAEAARAQAESVAKELSKRMDAGKSLLSDKLRAEAELARADIALEDLDHEIRGAKRMLATQWNARQTDFDIASGSLAIAAEKLDYEALAQQLSSHPRVQKLLSQERVAQSEIALEKTEAQSRWQFSNGVRRFENTDDYALVAGFTVPLGGEQRNSGRIAALAAERDRYRADADAMQIVLEARLYVLLQEFQHAQHVVGALREQILPRLEKAQSEARNAYQLGRYSYQDWRGVQQELLATRSYLLDSQFKAQLTRVEIERLSGLPLLGSDEVNP